MKYAEKRGGTDQAVPFQSATLEEVSTVLDGKRIRDEILAGLAPRIAALPRKPGLAVVLVGDNPASQVYVGSKVKTCLELGMHSEKIAPAASI